MTKIISQHYPIKFGVLILIFYGLGAILVSKIIGSIEQATKNIVPFT